MCATAAADPRRYDRPGRCLRRNRTGTSSEPDPRVDHDLDDGDNEVRDDDTPRTEEHRPEDERHIGRHDGIDRELADAWPGEDPLDDYDAAEEEPEVESD